MKQMKLVLPLILIMGIVATGGVGGRVASADEATTVSAGVCNCKLGLVMMTCTNECGGCAPVCLEGRTGVCDDMGMHCCDQFVMGMCGEG